MQELLEIAINSNITTLPMPNRNNLDDPVIPPYPDDPVITVHGETTFSNLFIDAMSNCFNVKQAKVTLSGLDEFFRNKIGRNTEDMAPVWIEFGKENPIRSGCAS